MPRNEPLFTGAPVVIRLSPKLNRALDKLAKDSGLSRSEVVRCMIAVQSGLPLVDELPVKLGKKGGKGR